MYREAVRMIKKVQEKTRKDTNSQTAKKKI